jgi:hypothetical protein
VTVTAPPRPPATGDPVDWGDPEALIAEAKQRARRRRRRYAAAVALLVLAATSLMVVFGRPEPSQSSLPEPPVLPVPADPDDAASIVAKYGNVDWGWVVVYGDGRVIKMFSARPPLDYTEQLFERRLTAKGLDLVRSGAIQPMALLPLQDRMWHCGPVHRIPGGTSNCVEITRAPAEVWADAEAKPYVPSRYAACLGTSGHLDEIPQGQATEIVGRLPAAARQLLGDKELRSYSNDLFPPSDLGLAPWLPDPPVECFEVSTQEAIVLFKTLRQAGFAFGWLIDELRQLPHAAEDKPDVLSARPEDLRPAPPPPWTGEVRGPCGGIKRPAAIVCFMPLLPHGQWVK